MMTKASADNSRFVLWLPVHLHDRFMLSCRNRGVTASDVLRTAVRNFVDTRSYPSIGDRARASLSIRETVGDICDEADTFD